MKWIPRNRLLKFTLPIAAVAALAFGGVLATLPAQAEDMPEQVKPKDVSSGDTRMVGGAPVTENKPWISALHTNGSFTCSSSQIGAEWVIIAAHCVENGGDLTVRIGSLQRSSGGQERAIDRVEIHPQYKWPDNDIALLHLAQPLENEYAPMATEADVQLGQESDIYGWGSEHEDWSGPLPETLKHSVGTTSTDYCVTANVVCMRGDAGVAGGDSGGPGFVKSPASGQFVLVGVCAIGHNPATTQWGAYTSIPHNAGWINEISGL